jgi:hypothetical protein
VQSVTYTISFPSPAAASTAASKLTDVGLQVEPDINDPGRGLRVTLDAAELSADAAFERLDGFVEQVGGDVVTWQVSRLDWSSSVPRSR